MLSFAVSIRPDLLAAKIAITRHLSSSLVRMLGVWYTFSIILIEPILEESYA